MGDGRAVTLMTLVRGRRIVGRRESLERGGGVERGVGGVGGVEYVRGEGDVWGKVGESVE